MSGQFLMHMGNRCGNKLLCLDVLLQGSFFTPCISWTFCFAMIINHTGKCEQEVVSKQALFIVVFKKIFIFKGMDKALEVLYFLRPLQLKPV